MGEDLMIGAIGGLGWGILIGMLLARFLFLRKED